MNTLLVLSTLALIAIISWPPGVDSKAIPLSSHQVQNQKSLNRFHNVDNNDDDDENKNRSNTDDTDNDDEVNRSPEMNNPSLERLRIGTNTRNDNKINNKFNREEKKGKKDCDSDIIIKRPCSFNECTKNRQPYVGICRRWHEIEWSEKVKICSVVVNKVCNDGPLTRTH